MKEGLFIILGLLMILIVPFAHPQKVVFGSEIHFLLKNWENDRLISNLPVRISIIDMETEKITSVLVYPKQTGEVIYTLDEGKYLVGFELENKSTERIDYFGSKQLNVINDIPFIEELYVYPVGTIEANVIASDGSIVNDAYIELKCSGHENMVFSNSTDPFGFYTTNKVPVGECIFFASKGEAVGKEEIQINQGNVTKIDVALDKNLLLSNPGISAIVLFLIIASGIVVYAIWSKNKSKKVESTIKKKVKEEVKKEIKKEGKDKLDGISPQKYEVNNVLFVDEKEAKEKGVNPRARDVLAILNEKEATITKFLLEQEDNKSTQSKIRHELGIPKTSIARLLKSLESKKVLAIKKDGKVKKINLTEWFMGK